MRSIVRKPLAPTTFSGIVDPCSNNNIRRLSSNQFGINPTATSGLSRNSLVNQAPQFNRQPFRHTTIDSLRPMSSIVSGLSLGLNEMTSSDLLQVEFRLERMEQMKQLRKTLMNLLNSSSPAIQSSSTFSSNTLFESGANQFNIDSAGRPHIKLASHIMQQDPGIEPWRALQLAKCFIEEYDLRR